MECSSSSLAISGGMHFFPKPSFYAVSTEDRTINPDLERFDQMYGRQDNRGEISHLSLISYPDEITRLILEAAGQTSR